MSQSQKRNSQHHNLQYQDKAQEEKIAALNALKHLEFSTSDYNPEKLLKKIELTSQRLNAVKAEIKELRKLKQTEVLELYTTEELRSLKRSVTTLMHKLSQLVKESVESYENAPRIPTEEQNLIDGLKEKERDELIEILSKYRIMQSDSKADADLRIMTAALHSVYALSEEIETHYDDDFRMCNNLEIIDYIKNSIFLKHSTAAIITMATNHPEGEPWLSTGIWFYLDAEMQKQ